MRLEGPEAWRDTMTICRVAMCFTLLSVVCRAGRGDSDPSIGSSPAQSVARCGVAVRQTKMAR
jgi:hypothetical protein